MKRAERREKFLLVDIYPVTAEALSEGRSNVAVLDGVLRGGARIVQLREKEYSTADLTVLAHRFREMTDRAGALLIINDRVDVALAAGADGVHLGQDDLPVRAARAMAPELLVGASSHSLEEALRAEADGADYVNIGPIFPTATKAGLTEFLGPGAIAAIGPKLGIPFTVMGGIDETNINEVLACGARRVAMVTGITKAPDIASRVRALREKIRASARTAHE
jgi:thiamine-phosphate pyrophosphorylase